MSSKAEADEAPLAKRKDALASVAGHISVLTTGDHATLRRMPPAGSPAADGVIVKLLTYAGVSPHEYGRDWKAWSVVIQIAALLSGTAKLSPHDPSRSFGKALHGAGLSETRFLRLTAAHGAALREQATLAGRRLAQKGAGPVDLRTLFYLVGRDPVRAERARLSLATDYFAALAAANP